MKSLKTLCAIALGMLMTACSSDDNAGSQILTPQASLLTQNYALYGSKNSEVTMAAGKTVMATRGCDVNGNMWTFMPEYMTDAEIAHVLEVIGGQKNPESVEFPPYTTFYVQHVGANIHAYDYEDYNHAPHTIANGNAAMELLQIQQSDDTWQHALNFNAGKCENAATHNCVKFDNGIKSVAAFNEYSASKINHYCVFYIDGDYYVGLDFDMKKDDGSVDADGVYDDWVIKIIPGEEETRVEPSVDPVDPTPTPVVNKGEVEFDIHKQQHSTWQEIKTSVHLRDTADVRIFLPIPKEYQAVADDFDIRTDTYQYMTTTSNETLVLPYTIGDKTYEVEVVINHTETGIEILIDGASCAPALKAARAVYDDGITFEIHSYVYGSATDDQIWGWLKTVECAQTSKTKWPVSGQCVTHTYGQVHAAHCEDEMIKFVKDPE